MKLYLVLLFALAVLPGARVDADAGVSQRIQSLSLRIEQNPEHQALRLQRALAYLEDNQPDRALFDIQLAETLGDPIAAAYTHGVLLHRQQNYAAALPYFDRYLQAYPDHWGALDYRARLLRDIGQNRLALADYEALLRLNRNRDPGYYVAAARLMASLPERGVNEALALLDNRMAQIGIITTLQRYAIDLEKQRGNYTAAITRMATLDEKLRATPQWQLDTAELHLQAARPHEALLYLAVAREQLQSSRATAVQQALWKRAHQLQQEAERAVLNLTDSPPDGAVTR